MKKYGTGEVIPEPDDDPKPFTDKDREDLRREQEEADEQ